MSCAPVCGVPQNWMSERIADGDGEHHSESGGPPVLAELEKIW